MGWRARLVGDMERDERARHTAELARLRAALRDGLAALKAEGAALRERHREERAGVRELARRHIERARQLRELRLKQLAEREAKERERLRERRRLLRAVEAERRAEVRQHRARLARAKRFDAERRREAQGKSGPVRGRSARERRAELADANDSNVLGARPELGAAWRALRRRYMAQPEGWRRFLEWAEAHPEEVAELTDQEAGKRARLDARALRRAEREHYRARRAEELAAVPF